MPDVDLNEVGSTGLNISGGEVHDEPLQTLRGEKGRTVLRQMSEDDSVVGSMLFAISMMLRQGEWMTEPNPADDDPTRTEFIDGALNDMDEPFADHVDAAASMLVYGWSYHEIVYKRRQGRDVPVGVPVSDFDDGRVGWARFPLRSQNTLLRWVYDADANRYSMIQAAAPAYTPVVVPWHKALHYVTTKARGNPEGRSALRTAYRDWYYKTRIQEIEGIGIERDLAGLPVGRVPVEYLSENAPSGMQAATAEFKKILRNIRRDDQAAILWPQAYDEHGNKMFDIELLSSGGARQIDTSQVITRYDQRIAMSVLADFVLLGHDQVGTQALSRSKIDLFVDAISAWMQSIADTINRQAIPNLLRVNGLPTALPPRVRPSGIDQTDLESLGEYIAKLSAAGMPLFPDTDLQQHLRAAGGMPPEPADFDLLDGVIPEGDE